MSNTNKIEILRALCYDKADLSLIANLPDDFSQGEIDAVIEFKKINEQGLGTTGLFGLKRFINRLMSEGAKGTLDSYTINYFVKELLNGPFKEYVVEYTRGSSPKSFFRKSPDIMGCLGEVARTPSNISICPTYPGYFSGTFPTILYKLPTFMIDIMERSSMVTEDLFRASMISTWAEDNTLPLVDKNPQARTSEEPQGSYDLGAIANYAIKDVTNYVSVMNPLVPVIQGNVKGVLKENTDYNKLYLYKKTNNLFETESESKNYQIQKTYKEGDKTPQTIIQDLMGEEFESDERRESEIVVFGEETSKTYVLNTNEGQLGG